MEAPDGSLTNPEIVPRSDCANSIFEITRIATNIKMLVRHAFFILRSVWERTPLRVTRGVPAPFHANDFTCGCKRLQILTAHIPPGKGFLLPRLASAVT